MEAPRGIAVLDVGATNTKLLLFDADLRVLASETVPSARRDGPPYRAIDPEPILALAAQALPDFDAIAPVDAVVPCTHGASLALLRADGALAMPIVDYVSEPPEEIVAAYAEIAPPFSEVFSPTNPACLTPGRQLLWQQELDPAAFASARFITPFPQALAHWLGGRVVTEYTSLGCQSHLWDFTAHAPSSLMRRMGWDALFPPRAPAWETVGRLAPRFRPEGFRGRGAVLAGIHDSSANYLRFAGSERDRFTLLSTGTWIIGFDAGADPARLDPACDTACGLTIHGAPAPICRFMGGEEFGRIAQGAPADPAALEGLIARGVMALPSFTDSGGPVPGTGGAGRLTGAVAAAERGALGALYCAQMTALALEKLSGPGATGRIVVDGPFGQNAAFLGCLAALEPQAELVASDLREGTAAGAALLALADAQGVAPSRRIALTPAPRFALDGLAAYHADWRRAIGTGIPES